MMDMNPRLNLQISKFIGFRLRKIEAHIEDLVFKDVTNRDFQIVAQHMIEVNSSKIIKSYKTCVENPVNKC